MKSYLITGGCGFIGINLVKRLRERGDAVRVLDNLSMGRREDLESLGAQLIVGDIRDKEDVAEAVKGCQTSVHLAAHTRVVESVSDPSPNFEVNVIGTMNVLQASHKAGVRKFIFASTGGAILGEQEPPVHEDMVPRPVSPYGASKLAGEAYCSAFAGSFGLNTVALRFSNVYGPYSYHKGSVVAQFFKNLLQGQPLTIYGDGSQTRDFVFVEDLIEAILLADQHDTPGEVFQIASGRETSIAELVWLMKQVLPGSSFDIRHEPARAGEISRNYARIEKASRLLAYEPKMQLEEGLERTWQWFLSKVGHLEFAIKAGGR
jgi:UDP-glucose 4-epimerase